MVESFRISFSLLPLRSHSEWMKYQEALKNITLNVYNKELWNNVLFSLVFRGPESHREDKRCALKSSVHFGRTGCKIGLPTISYLCYHHGIEMPIYIECFIFWVINWCMYPAIYLSSMTVIGVTMYTDYCGFFHFKIYFSLFYLSIFKGIFLLPH